jgi:acetylserotonin N-methyltransferase
MAAGATDPKPGPRTERLNELAFAFQNSAVLLAAIELGVFSAISDGVATTEAIAAKADVDPEAADRLLIVCKALDLVREKGGRYENRPDVERYLVKSLPTYFGDYLVYQAGVAFGGGKDLVEHLRGSNAEAQAKVQNTYAVFMATPESARRFTTAGYNASISLAHRLAKRFDFSRFKLWLDWAGGSGCYSIAACERHPGLRTIIMDQPNVIEVTKEFVAQHGLEDRIDIRPGDFLKTDYPKGCDLISFITPLQGYMPEQVIEILKRTHDALEPGGTCMVVDYMLNDEKTGPLDPALNNLAGVRHGKFIGRVNSGAEFREYFARAGFEEVEVWWLLEHQLGVVTGKKQTSQDMTEQ